MNEETIKRQKAIRIMHKEGKTYAEISTMYGISFQRVQQIATNQDYKIRPKSTKKNKVPKYTKRKGIIWDRAYKNNYLTEKHRENRKQAMNVLGGVCRRCGMDDERCLQIDHINGGGRKEIMAMSAYTRYMWIRNNSEEAKRKYQVLCANCNWIKRHENNEVMQNR